MPDPRAKKNPISKTRKDQRSDDVVDGASCSLKKLSITDIPNPSASKAAKWRASGSRPKKSDQSEKKEWNSYSPFATDQSGKECYTAYTPFATDQSSSGLNWAPPPRRQPIERKCDICGKDHYSSGCPYRVSVQPNTPINSRDYTIVCQCGWDFVGGVCSNRCRPGIPGRVVSNYPTVVTFGSPDMLPIKYPIRGA